MHGRRLPCRCLRYIIAPWETIMNSMVVLDTVKAFCYPAKPLVKPFASTGSFASCVLANPALFSEGVTCSYRETPVRALVVVLIDEIIMETKAKPPCHNTP